MGNGRSNNAYVTEKETEVNERANPLTFTNRFTVK